MNKLLKKIALAFAAFAVGFGFCFAPISNTIAFAKETTEEVTETPEISTDADEETNETPTVEEEHKEEENGENTGENKEDKPLDYEQILEFVGRLMEEEGQGDKWAQVVENLKTAATTKQVTGATIASLISAIALILYIVFKRISDGKLRKQIKEILESVEEERKKLNELVKAENECVVTEKELKAGLEKTMKALSAVAKGLMHFAEGVQLKDAKKTEVQNDCVTALREIDGVVTESEDNKK